VRCTAVVAASRCNFPCLFFVLTRSHPVRSRTLTLRSPVLAQVLHFDLMKSGIFSVLPWMTMAVTSNVGGWIADTLVTKGYSVTRVRKIMQTVRF